MCLCKSCENVYQLNDCVTDYINFRVGIQTRKKEVLCYPNNYNKPWITKDLKKIITEKKVLFAQGDRMPPKLKQKGLRGEIAKCNETYKRKIESHFKQGSMKETWSGIKIIRGYSKPNSPVPSTSDLNELNQF